MYRYTNPVNLPLVDLTFLTKVDEMNQKQCLTPKETKANPGVADPAFQVNPDPDPGFSWPNKLKKTNEKFCIYLF